MYAIPRAAPSAIDVRVTQFKIVLSAALFSVNVKQDYKKAQTNVPLNLKIRSVKY